MGVSRDCLIFGVFPIISGTEKATDFKFGRVHPNKSPLKIFEKRERGHIQGLSNFLGTPIISEAAKATNLKFGRYVRAHL